MADLDTVLQDFHKWYRRRIIEEKGGLIDAFKFSDNNGGGSSFIANFDHLGDKECGSCALYVRGPWCVMPDGQKRQFQWRMSWTYLFRDKFHGTEYEDCRRLLSAVLSNNDAGFGKNFLRGPKRCHANSMTDYRCRTTGMVYHIDVPFAAIGNNRASLCDDFEFDPTQFEFREYITSREGTLYAANFMGGIL